jgi:hypothetical protein
VRPGHLDLDTQYVVSSRHVFLLLLSIGGVFLGVVSCRAVEVYIKKFKRDGCK